MFKLRDSVVIAGTGTDLDNRVGIIYQSPRGEETVFVKLMQPLPSGESVVLVHTSRIKLSEKK